MLKRDCGILFLAACAVFLSLQNEGPFTLRKAWYHHFPEAEVDGALPSVYARLPAPVAADLNGDGRPEVLMATPGGHLVVVAPRKPGDGFAPALVLHEVAVGGGPGAAVIALTTGYIDPHPGNLVRALRKQIVVVATAAGDVVALDHNLKELWRQSLAPHMPAGGRLDEAALLVTEHGVNKGDRGLVVVGARAEPDTLADDFEEDDFLEEEVIGEGLERAHERGRAPDSKLLEVEGAGGGAGGRHFSYFAFAGATGALRWKHEAADFHRDLTGLQEAMVTTQHSLHAAAQLAEGVHFGEASCREYREAVLAALPHAWFGERDTRLGLAHFHKHRPHAGGGAKAALAAPGRQLAAAPPGDKGAALMQRGAHHAPPNVIVAHVEEGLEAVHLFSGRTVCRLFLDPYTLHADLNGDGVPDHVHAVGGDAAALAEEAVAEDTAHAHHRYCAATVTTGIPPKGELFNGTICAPVRFGLARARRLGYIDVAPPAALPLPGKGGHYRRQVLRQKAAAVFLTSRGDLTAYSPAGEVLWQQMSPAYWRTDVEEADADAAEDNPEAVSQEDMEEEAFMPEPTLAAVPLRRHAIASVVLAGGEDQAALFSEHGTELASVELPEHPTQPLVALDWNLDGYTDLVEVGRAGVYAWAQVRRPGAVPFAALVGVLIVTMVTVFITQQGFMQGGGPGGRSTDRVD